MNKNMSFIGTMEQAIEIVPTAILSIMAGQKRPNNYIFRATVDLNSGFCMVW